MIENAVAVAENGRDWFDYVTAVGPVITPLLVAYIAWQQRNINKNRLEHEKLARQLNMEHEELVHELRMKYELFDRRYTQFAAVQEFLADILQKGDSSQDNRVKVYQATRGSLFLFDDKISQFIKELIEKAGQLEYIIKQRKAAVDREAGRRLADREDHLLAWFEGQSNDLESRFAPYLHLKQDVNRERQ